MLHDHMRHLGLINVGMWLCWICEKAYTYGITILHSHSTSRSCRPTYDRKRLQNQLKVKVEVTVA